MQNYQATHHFLNLKQHHSPHHSNRFLSTVVYLHYSSSISLRDDFLFTFKSTNLLSPTLTVFPIHYITAGSSGWLYPESVMLSHWLEWRTGPLPTAVISTSKPRSYNFTTCKSSSLAYHKSLYRFNFVRCSSTLDESNWWHAITFHKDTCKVSTG